VARLELVLENTLEVPAFVFGVAGVDEDGGSLLLVLPLNPDATTHVILAASDINIGAVRIEDSIDASHAGISSGAA
jgi:hypothetical protein